MFHRSERLLLRPVWPEDWQAVFGGIADEGVVRNLARAPWPYSQQDARDFTARTADPKFPKFLITLAGSAQVVGCIGTDSTKDHVGVVELGYWVARTHWGQGIATEAGRAVIEIARALGHRQFIASHFLDNPASGRVLEKIGFAPTGRIVARHSCGRGEEAMTVEYALDLFTEERRRIHDSASWKFSGECGLRREGICIRRLAYDGPKKIEPRGISQIRP